MSAVKSWWLQETVAVLVVLAVALMVITHCTGCAAAPVRTLNAVEIGQETLPYSHELDVCREETKKLPKAERFDAYIECEKIETRRICERKPNLKAHWARCREVLP